MADGNGIFGIHGAALALRSQRLEMLASNIANAATPNYKARDIDFGKALELATNGRTAKDAVDAALAYRVPVTPSHDGNPVELSTEQTLFPENPVQYRTPLPFIEGPLHTPH